MVRSECWFVWLGEEGDGRNKPFCASGIFWFFGGEFSISGVSSCGGPGEGEGAGGWEG